MWMVQTTQHHTPMSTSHISFTAILSVTFNHDVCVAPFTHDIWGLTAYSAQAAFTWELWDTLWQWTCCSWMALASLSTTHLKKWTHTLISSLCYLCQSACQWNFAWKSLVTVCEIPNPILLVINTRQACWSWGLCNNHSQAALFTYCCRLGTAWLSTSWTHPHTWAQLSWISFCKLQ